MHENGLARPAVVDFLWSPLLSSPLSRPFYRVGLIVLSREFETRVCQVWR